MTRLPNYFEAPELAIERPRLAAALAEYKRRFILAALSRNGGNRKAAAAELGIGYSTLKQYLGRGAR